MRLTSENLETIGYRIKLYPNEEQEEIFKRYFGASRFVYNLGISLENEAKENEDKFLSYFSLERKLTELKKTDDYNWLNDYDTKSMALIMKDVQNSYIRFFNKLSNHPKYHKKKHGYQMFATRSERLKVLEDTVKLPSIGIVSCDRHNHSEIIGSGNKNITSLPYKHYYNARVIFDGCDYWLTFSLEKSYEEGIEANSCKRFKNNEVWQQKEYSDTIGIDLGCKGKNWIVDSRGNRIDRPDTSKEEKQIKKYHRKFMHKKLINDKMGKKTNSTITEVKRRKYTNNEEKILKKYNKAYKRMTNKKKAAIHDYACSIISEKPECVIMEDLSVTNMYYDKSDDISYTQRIRHNKNIQSSMLYTVRTIIERKCQANNINFKLADREFPSSQLCSRCGHRQKIGILRTYKCPVCGLEIDRDLNAAYNLSNYDNYNTCDYIIA